MFPGSVTRTYGSRKKFVCGSEPDSVLKSTPAPTILSDSFSPSPSPLKSTSLSTFSLNTTSKSSTTTGTKISGTAKKGIKKVTLRGTRTPLRPLTNQDLFSLEADSSFSSSTSSSHSTESIGSSDSERPRRSGKRGVPGTPREEPTSSAKTTRLFSPVVTKKKSGTRGVSSSTESSSHHHIVHSLRGGGGGKGVENGGEDIMPSSLYSSTTTTLLSSQSDSHQGPPFTTGLSGCLQESASILRPPKAPKSRRAHLPPSPPKKINSSGSDSSSNNMEGEDRKKSQKGGLMSLPPLSSSSSTTSRRSSARLSGLPPPALENSSSLLSTPLPASTTTRRLLRSATKAAAAAAAAAAVVTEMNNTPSTAEDRQKENEMEETICKGRIRSSSITPKNQEEKEEEENMKLSTVSKGTVCKSRQSMTSAASTTTTRAIPPRSSMKGGSATGSSEFTGIFSETEVEDLDYLSEELKKTGEATWRFGFGKGFVMSLPLTWDSVHRGRLRQLLLSLGFQCQAHSGRVYYRMSNQKVSELRRELSRWRAEHQMATTAAANKSSSALHPHTRGFDFLSEIKASRSKNHRASRSMKQLMGTAVPIWHDVQSDGETDVQVVVSDDGRRGEEEHGMEVDDVGEMVESLGALVLGTGGSRNSSSNNSSSNKKTTSSSQETREVENPSRKAEEEDREKKEEEEDDSLLNFDFNSDSFSYSSLPHRKSITLKAALDLSFASSIDKGEPEEEEDMMKITTRNINRSSDAEDKNDTSCAYLSTFSKKSSTARVSGSLLHPYMSHEDDAEMKAAPSATTPVRLSTDSFIIHGVPFLSDEILSSPPSKTTTNSVHTLPLSSPIHNTTQKIIDNSTTQQQSSHDDVCTTTGHEQPPPQTSTTFETPLGAKKKDWGVSLKANTHSIHRLTQHFESTEAVLTAGDYNMLPSHLRYNLTPPLVAPAAPSEGEGEIIRHLDATTRSSATGLPKRLSLAPLDEGSDEEDASQEEPPSDFFLEEEYMRDQNTTQADLAVDKSEHMLQQSEEENTAMLLRRRRSAAKARRVSMGLMARASLLRQQHNETRRQMPGHNNNRSSSFKGGKTLNSRLSLSTVMGGLSLLVSSSPEPQAHDLPSSKCLMMGQEYTISEAEEETDSSSMLQEQQQQEERNQSSVMMQLEDDEMMMMMVQRTTTADAMSQRSTTTSTGALDQISENGLLVHCLEYLSIQNLLAPFTGPGAVSHTWSLAALHAQARIFSDFSTYTHKDHEEMKGHAYSGRPDLLLDWRKLADFFPCGQFLSEGAYKSVYRVWCNQTERMEALSVMNVRSITASGNVAILAQELQASLLMSALVRGKICPNHVETYGILRTNHVPVDLWRCSNEEVHDYLQQQDNTEEGTNKKKKSQKKKKSRVPSKSSLGDYQLIRMELCRYGDLETYLRRQPEGLISITLLRQLLFQMCFALYAARETHDMRHYDIKLLNFLLADFADVSPSARSRRNTLGPVHGHHHINATTTNQSMHLKYGFGSDIYVLEMPVQQALCVKLADFGTADLTEETFDQPVGLDQYTTLENTPIDFLVLGDAAVQNFAADAFSLGLALWHLFTGSAPYEEILQDVLCPMELMEVLKPIWTTNRHYSVLAQVLDASGEEEEEDLTLYHTFYRYLVLLGLPSFKENSAYYQGGRKNIKKNPVWKAVLSLIDPDPFALEETHDMFSAADNTERTQREKTRKIVITEKYWKDHGKYSIESGRHPYIARGRCRLQGLPGAKSLLLSLLHYNPEERPGMYQALTSEIFAPLRLRNGQEEAIFDQFQGSSYMAYYRGGNNSSKHDDSQSATLPLRRNV